MNSELEGPPGRATTLYFQQFGGPRKGQDKIPSHSHNYGPRSEFFRLSWCGHCACRTAPGVMWATFPSLWGQFLYLFVLHAPHHWTLGWLSWGNAKEERTGFPKALLPHKSLPVQGGACKENWWILALHKNCWAATAESGFLTLQLNKFWQFLFQRQALQTQSPQVWPAQHRAVICRENDSGNDSGNEMILAQLQLQLWASAMLWAWLTGEGLWHCPVWGRI